MPCVTTAKGESAVPTLSDELSTLPMAESVMDLYNSAKCKSVLGVGFQIMEWSTGVVTGTINTYCGGKVEWMDQYAGGFLSTLKENYPIINQPTSEVLEQIAEASVKFAKSSAGCFMQSFPGRTVLFGLDGVISASSNLLNRVQPVNSKKRLASPRKPIKTKPSENGPVESKKNSDTTKSTQTPQKPSNDQKTPTTTILKRTEKKPTNRILSAICSLILAPPLRITLKYTKKLRSILLSFSTEKGRSTRLSPEKEIEIDSRRKVSPRKRLKTTFFGRITKTVGNLFGIGSKAISLTQADIRSYFYRDSNKSDDAERKRKYDEIQTDQDSEDSLAGFDMDVYRSDEDSDYEVPSGDSTDSMEYAAGDTESDIELEDKENQNKENKDTARTRAKSTGNKSPQKPSQTTSAGNKSPQKPHQTTSTGNKSPQKPHQTTNSNVKNNSQGGLKEQNTKVQPTTNSGKQGTTDPIKSEKTDKNPPPPGDKPKKETVAKSGS